MVQPCFKPTTLRLATYVHQFSSAKLWNHVEGSFLETMRVCTSWWSKFDSWQFDFICDNPNQKSLTLWQWWNHCLSMIRSGLIAPGVFHLDSIITLWDGRRPIWRQWQPLRTVHDDFVVHWKWGYRSHPMTLPVFQVFSRMDFEPWKTVTVTRWRASSLTHILQSNKAQPDRTYSTYLVARRHFD